MTGTRFMVFFLSRAPGGGHVGEEPGQPSTDPGANSGPWDSTIPPGLSFLLYRLGEGPALGLLSGRGFPGSDFL